MEEKRIYFWEQNLFKFDCYVLMGSMDVCIEIVSYILSRESVYEFVFYSERNLPSFQVLQINFALIVIPIVFNSLSYSFNDIFMRISENPY